MIARRWAGLPVILFFLGTALAGGLLWWDKHWNQKHGGAKVVHTSPDPVLIVGNHRFSARDIELKRKQIAWKYPDYPDDKVELVAYARLIRGYLLAKVLEAKGHAITWAQLKAELNRIEEETRRADKLDELKSLFADAPGKYATIGILPQFANRRYFYEVFPELEPVQGERKRRAARMLRRIKQGEIADLAQAASSAEHWRYGRYLFHPERGFLRVPTSENGELDENTHKRRRKEWTDGTIQGEKANFYGRLEEGIFSKLAEGEVFNQTVEFDRDFSILRSRGWHNREQSIRVVGRLALAKVSPHTHFREKASAFPVWIKDERLQSRLLQLKSRFEELDWQENASRKSRE